MLIYHVHFHL